VSRGLHKRLARIEALAAPLRRRSSPVLCLDYDGTTGVSPLDNKMRAWAGRHVSEWPAEWWYRPTRMMLIVNISRKGPPADLSCLEQLPPGRAPTIRRRIGHSIADL
jgi:hypothetical protein